ncbi:hypothetical protein PSA7680_00298 [Pseudoruegeria aquimaris]|uniref:Uncharacterized protein n=1 Tax=Pseudoruegeria aquimaris TaxID=393663 RepID=A0A1Y5RE60_9RHOB|nr:hypothetical protein [Pseudoruegeria aquimaris]SLN14165.1 hypothetical protein PSA7680_00298 [Pseudoruegeria aquimaris]
MTTFYEPDAEDGEEETQHFNPRCNQATYPGGYLNGAPPSSAEVAEREQARYAARQAAEEAYRQALAEQKAETAESQA